MNPFDLLLIIVGLVVFGFMSWTQLRYGRGIQGRKALVAAYGEEKVKRMFIWCVLIPIIAFVVLVFVGLFFNLM